ncbi:hypothetical protein GCM10009007_03330 [Formosimonas limnophila]|uniref:Anti-CBASS protein Acb1-like N-terminal domain-containing protein n=1 Tax=Formosimonas limnophila TaxID=1384487 RepID=A0A8J3G069_9BURK|nr:anti-CBASS Acb1 family protein [Formosimonas limnophila]GHA66203.1 hypothetical protein GCM10009007_03330 [Formosimonas limnophila]
MDKTIFSPYAAAAGWRALGFNFSIQNMPMTEMLKQPLVINALTAPINDAIKAWRILDDDGYAIERKFGYQHLFHDAVLLAKINGNALVIPVTTKDMASKITGGVNGFQVVQGKRNDDGVFSIKTKNGDEKLIHPDNVFEVFSLSGFRTQSLRDLNIISGSEVDLITEAYTVYKKGLDEIFYILKRAIVDTRGIKDLADQMDAAVTDEQKIDLVMKLKAVHQATNGTDNHTGVVYDLDLEKVERLSIASALDGIVKAFNELKNNFVASTRIPEVKIFGSQVGGIGNNDASTLSIYFDMVEQLMQTTLYDMLQWMDAMAGFDAPKIVFGSVRPQSESEKIGIEKTQAEIDKIYFDMLDTAVQDGILKRIESRYGSLDGSQSTDTTSTD